VKTARVCKHLYAAMIYYFHENDISINFNESGNPIEFIKFFLQIIRNPDNNEEYSSIIKQISNIYPVTNLSMLKNNNFEIKKSGALRKYRKNNINNNKEINIEKNDIGQVDNIECILSLEIKNNEIYISIKKNELNNPEKKKYIKNNKISSKYKIFIKNFVESINNNNNKKLTDDLTFNEITKITNEFNKFKIYNEKGYINDIEYIDQSVIEEFINNIEKLL
jgi:hypothetical protein